MPALSTGAREAGKTSRLESRHAIPSPRLLSPPQAACCRPEFTHTRHTRTRPPTIIPSRATIRIDRSNRSRRTELVLGQGRDLGQRRGRCRGLDGGRRGGRHDACLPPLAACVLLACLLAAAAALLARARPRRLMMGSPSSWGPVWGGCWSRGGRDQTLSVGLQAFPKRMAVLGLIGACQQPRARPVEVERSSSGVAVMGVGEARFLGDARRARAPDFLPNQTKPSTHRVQARVSVPRQLITLKPAG